MTATTNDLVISGTLEMKLLNQATAQGWTVIPGVAKLEISQSAEIIEAPMSKDRGSYGTIPASAAKPKPTEIKLGLSRTIGSALPMGLMGTQVSASQSSGALTAQSFTVAAPGQGIDLGKRNIGVAGFSVTHTSGTPTYVEGTDYTVNRRLGTLYPVVGGAITASQVVKVTCTYGAAAWNKLSAGNTVQWQCALRIDGVNLFDNLDLDLEIPSATLATDGAVDFLSDKPVDLNFTGRINQLAGQDLYTLHHGMAYS